MQAVLENIGRLIDESFDCKLLNHKYAFSRSYIATLRHSGSKMQVPARTSNTLLVTE